MDQTKSLVANSNKLKQLKLRIERDTFLFPGMKKLKVAGKDLEILPAEIFLIDELDVLDLSPEREACMEFRLHRIPLEVGRMINLKVLIVDLNGIRAVPGELAKCKNLEKLSLSNNLIAHLPENFSQLQNLTTLHLANNWVKTFPEMICNIVTLEFLDMSDNLIGGIPPNIGQLKELISFIICQNKISEIPGEIGKLQNLRTLWIGNNRVSRLPTEITSLENLDWGGSHTPSSTVDGNPLEYPPVDVCKQGIKAMAEYFEKVSNGQQHREISRISDYP